MINSLQSALASAERTFEMLDEEEEIPDPEHPAVAGTLQGQRGLRARQLWLQPRPPADAGHQFLPPGQGRRSP